MKASQFAELLEFIAMGLSSGLVLDEACRFALESIGPKSEPSGVDRSGLGLFKDFLEKSKVPVRWASVVYIVEEAYRNGAPLQDVLLEQASFLREEELWNLEEAAQTLSLKLLFPTLVFIFPGVFVLLLGSLYLQISQQGFLF